MPGFSKEARHFFEIDNYYKLLVQVVFYFDTGNFISCSTKNDP